MKHYINQSINQVVFFD